MERKSEYKKGLWTEEEDRILMEYIKVHGKGKWNRLAKVTGLKRCGKSCRLRWMNYLSPSVKRGDFSEEENDLIIRLHNLLGNRWSLIAGRVPGRTDNQVKNHWNTHLSRKLEVKKGKNKVISSSQTLSKEYLRENNINSIPSSLNPPPPNICNDIGETNQQKVVMKDDGCPSTQGLTTGGDGYVEDFFRFSTNYDLHTPNLIEFLNESDDVFWQGLM